VAVSSVKFATPAFEARLEPSSGLEEHAALVTERPVALHSKEVSAEEKPVKYPNLDKKKEFRVNAGNLNENYSGHYGKLKKLCDEIIGDPDKWEADTKTVTHNGVTVTFFRRSSIGCGLTAAAREEDRVQVEKLLALKKSYTGLNKETEFPVNGTSLSKNYSAGNTTFKKLCDEVIGDPEIWEADTKEVTHNGVAVTFFRRGHSGHPTAAARVEDRVQVEKLLDLKKSYPILNKETEFAVNGRNLSKNYSGGNKLKEHCDDVIGDPETWEAETKEVTHNGVAVTFYRRLNGVHPTAAAREEDRTKVEKLLALKRTYPNLNKETEFAVNGGSLSEKYSGDEKNKKLVDEVIGDPDAWGAETKEVTHNGVTVTFFRRLNGVHSTAAAREEDRVKVEELLALKKPYPNLDKETEFAVNGEGLSEQYFGDYQKLKKLCDDVIGDPENWEADTKEVTHNGVIVTFLRRFNGKSTAAAREEDRVKVEELLALKKSYTRLNKETEFAVNGCSLSENYSGGNRTFKKLCDAVIGDPETWEAETKEVTHNGVTVTFYRRLSGSNSTAAAREEDWAKVEKLLDLKDKITKADLTEEEIIKAARIYYEEHGKLPSSHSPELVPGMPNETWSVIAQACAGGYRGLEEDRTLTKILKPLRDSLGSSLTRRKLPKIFQNARLVKKLRTKNSNSKEIRSSLSLNKSRSVTFLKGEALEQVVGLLLLSRFPDQQVVPQYCLKVDPKQAYYGMRADYKVGDDIYEVKWGHATDNINETAEKHKKALGLKQANYRMILLNPNHEVKHDYALFHNLNRGLGVSNQLDQLVCDIQELTQANNSEVLEKLRDYFYGLVMKANSLKNDERKNFLVKELDGLLASEDKLEYAKKHSYALYSPLEAYFNHEGNLYRGLITPKALIEESPENYGLNYSLDDITFEDFRDLDLAVKLEMSSEYGPLRIEDLLEEDRKYYDKAIFTLPDGLTVSYHKELEPGLPIKNPEEISDILKYSEGDYEFAEEFMASFKRDN
jgi:uncharacterized protein YerC